MKIICVIVFLKSMFVCLAFSASAGDVDVVVEAARESFGPTASGSRNECKRIWNDHFAGWSDRRILTAFVDCGTAIQDEIELIYIGGTPLFVITSEMVQDVSSLRKMLASEENPRKFFVESVFAAGFTSRRHEDFIPEQFHMLFVHGRIVEKHPHHPAPLSDVSSYAYWSIVAALKRLSSDFDERKIIPHGEDAPYSVKIPFLAEWLKENWPGCENLEIPGESSVGGGSAEQAMAARDLKPRAGVSEPASSRPADRHILLWVTAGGISILAGTIIVCLAKRRAKR